MTEMKKCVEKLIKKAAEVEDDNAAMKYSQAALNTANALCALKTAEKI